MPSRCKISRRGEIGRHAILGVVAKAVRVRVSPTAPKQRPACMTRLAGPDGQGHSGEHILKMNLDQYLPVLLFHLGRHRRRRCPLVLGWHTGPQPPRCRKELPYECGFEAFEDARMKFDVRYYLVAILFILFDLEIAFLSLGRSRCTRWVLPVSWRSVVFLAILVVGFAYEWKKGALDWGMRRTSTRTMQ